MILQVNQLSHTIHVNLPYMDGWYVFFLKNGKKKSKPKTTTWGHPQTHVFSADAQEATQPHGPRTKPSA